MRIVQIGLRETAGSMFFLAHAINKLTKHRAVNIRFLGSYLRYPAMIDGGEYGRDEVRKMLYKADVVHFHICAHPLFESLQLDPRKFEDKATFLYYHGSQLRTLGDDLTAENREVLPDHVATVSTPDLLDYVEDGVWLPVIRPFKELEERFGMSRRDERAIRLFSKKRQIFFVHPTTGVEKKGSQVFFEAVTKAIRMNEHIRFVSVMNTTWDMCMRRIGMSDVMLGDAKLGIIQLTAVEAAIFRVPVVSLLTPETRQMYVDQVGEAPPFVSWNSIGDLIDKINVLTEKPDVRKILGQQIHDYLQPLHDERPVVDKYLGLIESYHK